ncbi:MAG: hypothetical protein RSD01_01135, partial [Ruthenibacterium sp.]
IKAANNNVNSFIIGGFFVGYNNLFFSQYSQYKEQRTRLVTHDACALEAWRFFFRCRANKILA